jgi:DNA mismatch repair protein MutL
MPHISVLSKEISELIAAGEVIERPASVIKEVVENAVDAGAKHITVEIKRGGTIYMRITDDGCGMQAEDVPMAFLRHATSKISVKDDLDSIYTLGFRGEALASISAVAKVSLLTKRREDSFGTRYDINGSVPDGNPEPTGCPDGTTIIIRDLFYNVPVRQRFMKKDVSEANAVSQIVQKIALSHPDIAFQMIRDNRLEFCTDGSGDLYAAIYAIYGKEFAHDMVPVEFDDGYLNVIGYTCKPLYAKSSRSFQIFFINGRYVRSRVCSVAVESAYENLIMTGKFPSCVLMISVNASDIDVNVHPTKAEVRFTNEKNVADGLYFSIKNALMQSGLIYEFRIHPPKPVTDWTAPVPETSVFSQPPLPEIPIPVSSPVEEYVSFESVMSESNGTNNISITSPIEKSEPAVKIEDPYEYKDVFVDVSDIELEETENTATDISHDEVYIEKRSESLPNDTTYEKTDNISHLSEIKNEASDIDIRVVGEIFKNYIIAEAENNIVIFDKHAAHERVIFEKLRAGTAGYSRQMLMTPVKLLLSTEEADALQNNGKLLSGMGFSFDFESTPNVLVTGVPTFALNLNIDEIVTEIARNIVLGKANPNPSYLDDTFHSIACKAAIKANDKNDLIELQKLAHEVYNNENIRHCPHGRPVMFVITKHELEKQFRRI